MGWIIGLLVSRGFTEKRARLLAEGGLVMLVVLGLGAVVLWIRHDAVSDHQVKMERRAAPATNRAADERANDTIRNSKNEQEMHDVIAAQPDQPIAPSSRALSCERLRRAHVSSPACSRPAGSR